jgi:hypothetical protein
MSTLNNFSSLLIYEDANPTNAPLTRDLDWRRNITSFPVSNPQNQGFQLPPGASQLIFSGTRTTTIDGTTAFTVTINSANSSLYRFTATAGTTPGFRTDRGLTLTGDTMTITVNNNVSATFTLAINNWGPVSVGDTLFIPNALTGDPPGPFNPTNGGYWIIIGKGPGGTPQSITVTRLPGQSFSGVSESQTMTTNSQLDVFSSSGVQIGDTVEISAGFSTVTQQAYTISTITSTRFEVLVTSPIPLESGILPGATGMVFYNNAKRFVRVEVDQTAYVQFNGDTGQTVRIVPQVPGNIQTGFGYMEKLGVVFQLTIVNKNSAAPCNVIFISAS